MLFDVTAVADALKPFSDFSYCGIDITPLPLTTRRGSRNARVDALKSMNFQVARRLRGDPTIYGSHNSPLYGIITEDLLMGGKYVATHGRGSDRLMLPTLNCS